MTECQEEAHDLLNEIIHEQEQMLQRITNDHDEFLSKSSSAFSLNSDLNDQALVSLNVYKILNLPSPSKKQKADNDHTEMRDGKLGKIGDRKCVEQLNLEI